MQNSHALNTAIYESQATSRLIYTWVLVLHGIFWLRHS